MKDLAINSWNFLLAIGSWALIAFILLALFLIIRSAFSTKNDDANELIENLLNARDYVRSGNSNMSIACIDLVLRKLDVIPSDSSRR